MDTAVLEAEVNAILSGYEANFAILAPHLERAEVRSQLASSAWFARDLVNAGEESQAVPAHTLAAWDARVTRLEATLGA